MPVYFIFLINTFASIFMTGLIWLVQLVHYPSFRFVHASDFKQFHNFHNGRISLMVIPVMMAELTSSGILWWHSGFFSIHGFGFYLVIGTWLATAFLSVPAHARLRSGKDITAINFLISTNWVRTTLWTVKSILSLTWV